ncbi:DUF4870 domain-containing protein [Chryseobacterium sp. 2987]|uniref:DUF4870 domain-containing protein n=1 Tax=Chryseobacterium sp. 2987 TaxID=2817767 RepID=UPI00285CECC2|nr:DUF4870 domain-containing protein [Chryseobacterium sp. 2987]MDR6919719.1 putative membrane protein [Chryseobacterium sp. 2987]
MDNKTLSIVSYISIVGWLIAYFMGKDHSDSILRYHLRQSLGLAIISILFSVVLNVLAMLIPALGILGILSLGIVILWIIGIINAANNAQKPLPVIGKMFEDKFSFIG